MYKQKRKKKQQPKTPFERYLALPASKGGPKKRRLEDLVEFSEESGKEEEEIDIMEVLKEALYVDNFLVDGFNNKKQRVEMEDEVRVTSPIPSYNNEQPISMSGEETERKTVPVNPQTDYQEKKDKANWIESCDPVCEPYLNFEGLSEGEPRAKDEELLSLGDCSRVTEKEATAKATFFYDGIYQHEFKYP
jgi:hypothetical protein